MKKNIINKRGFTLIELLAVIIILAVIMVFAIPAVLDTSNNAQKKTFQVYGERLNTLALTKLEGDRLLGLGENSGSLTAAQVGLKDTGGYNVCIKYSKDDTSDETNLDYTITLIMNNGRLCTAQAGEPAGTVTADSYTPKTDCDWTVSCS